MTITNPNPEVGSVHRLTAKRLSEIRERAARGGAYHGLDGTQRTEDETHDLLRTARMDIPDLLDELDRLSGLVGQPPTERHALYIGTCISGEVLHYADGGLSIQTSKTSIHDAHILQADGSVAL